MAHKVAIERIRWEELEDERSVERPHSNSKGRNVKTLVSAFVAVLLLGTTLGVLISAQTPSIPTVIEPGSMVGQASYVIFTDGATIFAKSGTTGAMLTSSTDAYTLFNAVMGNLSTIGGRIFVSKGTYPFSTQLKLVSNIEIQGEGVSSIIQMANAANLDGMWFSNLVTGPIGIHSLTFDGNVAQQTSFGHLLVMRRTSNITIENCVFQNSYGKAIGIWDNVGDQKSISIQNNRFVNIGQSGVDLQDRAKEVIIQGNFFQNCNERNASNHVSAIYFQNTCGRLVIKGNIIVNIPGGPPNWSTGAIVALNVNLGEVIIEGNQIYNCAGQGMLFTTCTNVTVANNIIEHCGLSGIYFEQVSRGTITGNILSYTGTSRPTIDTGIGITLGGLAIPGTETNMTVVSGNVVEYSGAQGIWAWKKCVITSNIVRDNCQVNDTLFLHGNAGIIAQGGADGAIISNNIVYDDQIVKTQLYGISDTWGGGYLSDTPANYLIITGNNVSGNGLAGMYINGTGDIIRNNLGWVTQRSGNITITGAFSSVTVNHNLDMMPSIVTATCNNTGCGNFAVTSIALTQFVITFTVQPGTSEWKFYWYAEV